MTHETEIVATEELSNGQYAVHIKCCGQHEHRHTVGPLVMTDAAKFTASVDEARATAALHHESAKVALATLEALKGQKKTHAL